MALNTDLILAIGGPENIQQTARNLPLRGLGTKTTLWNKVMEEVEKKSYAGPFKEIPFVNFLQSPIGLVPKDGGKDVRLIFHLSYPRNSEKSLNANAPKDKCRVSYPDFCEAIKLCLRAGKSCKLSKLDMKLAFRNLGILRSQWKYLVMMAQSPIDEIVYYFIDKCLPFGASLNLILIVPYFSHFQTLWLT